MATATRQKPSHSAEESLKGPQKVAILLMALGAEAAGKITENLSGDELEAVSFEIARLNNVPASTIQSVLEEWEETERAAGSLAEGGVDYARQILEQALGAGRASAVLKRIESSAGLYNLRNADPQQLSGVLRNEHPQTIALILAHVTSSQTAAVLKEIEPHTGAEVLYRMARMEKVLPEVLHVVERSLGSDSDLSFSQDMSAAGGPGSVAAVLNLVAGSLEKELVEGLARHDPELCEEIKNLMFVFEDIVKLDDRALQRVIRDIELKELALALKATSIEVKSRITGLMSQRAAASLKEEIEFLGPVRVRDVEAAQTNIARLVRNLAEAGEIVVGLTDDLVIE